MSFIVAAMMVLGITGCGDEKVSTVEFYEKNDAAREATRFFKKSRFFI
ncbi:hypothetical protein [Campylobacter sp. RM16192]|nr:hypothetical protein [Campylobacter sp. RM16192]